MKKIIIIFCFILILLSFFLSTNNKNDENNESSLEEDEITAEMLEEGLYEITDEITNYIKIDVNEYGDIIAVLYPNIAPITVENIQTLISNNFYDNLTFHRVVKNFVIQTGDPTATGRGGSEQTIKGEFSNNNVKNSLSHTRGILSMARKSYTPETDESYNSASSQFFIVQEDATYLDGNYAAFGKVLLGMDIVDKICDVDVDSNDKPINDIIINNISFIKINEEN